jgi:hypothetical protein
MDSREGHLAAVTSVLLELLRVLGEHRNCIVLVGGMVPRVLLGAAGQKHIGTIDLDLVVDHAALNEDAYSSIVDLLLAAGYTRGDLPSRFERRMNVGGHEIVVPVDFLAGAAGGTGQTRRHQNFSGMKLRKLRGGELVNVDPVEIPLTGKLPDGSLDDTRLRVVTPCLYVVLKALAIADRLRPKDCYDLYFVLRSQRDDVSRLGVELAKYRHHPAVEDALVTLKEKFASIDHIGPRHASELIAAGEGEDLDMTGRDAFELVQAFIHAYEDATSGSNG